MNNIKNTICSSMRSCKRKSSIFPNRVSTTRLEVGSLSYSIKLLLLRKLKDWSPGGWPRRLCHVVWRRVMRAVARQVDGDDVVTGSRSLPNYCISLEWSSFWDPSQKNQMDQIQWKQDYHMWIFFREIRFFDNLRGLRTSHRDNLWGDREVWP